MERALIFYIAMVLFVANFARRTRAVSHRGYETFRWLHHALFFAVFASAAVAVGVGFLQGAPYRWVLLPVLVLFAFLPRVRAGTPGHAALASGAMIFYVTGFVWML